MTVIGFNVHTFGTTDKNNSFHPFGYGISTEETKKDFEFIFQNLKKGMELVQPDKDFKPKYLIADNAYAICNGFLSGM